MGGFAWLDAGNGAVLEHCVAVIFLCPIRGSAGYQVSEAAEAARQFESISNLFIPSLNWIRYHIPV